jgi:hypothetical protein
VVSCPLLAEKSESWTTILITNAKDTSANSLTNLNSPKCFHKGTITSPDKRGSKKWSAQTRVLSPETGQNRLGT